MSTDKFVRQFGRPAYQRRGRLDYPEDGLAVLSNAAGTISGFLFSWEQQRIGGPMIANGAGFQTDTGIGVAATYRRFVELHGIPEEEVVGHSDRSWRWTRHRSSRPRPEIS